MSATSDQLDFSNFAGATISYARPLTGTLNAGQTTFTLDTGIFPLNIGDGITVDGVLTDTSTVTWQPGFQVPDVSDGTFLLAHWVNPGNGFTVSKIYHIVGHNGDALLAQSYDFDANASANWYVLASTGIVALYETTPDPEPDAGTPLTFTIDGTDAPFGLQAVCFAEGTRISTAHGDRLVEELTEGDIVVTVSGAMRPVKWIGEMIVRPARHARPHQVAPVRIKAGAFGPNLPLRDLRVSPGHAIYVDGVLIPAGCLVNGATIVQEVVESIRYFHVELESHDVLLAEGLPCESYLDDGNRMNFSNAGDFVALHGRLDPKSWDNACAPMVAAGPQLDEVRRRLHARAEELGWMKSEDADLRILADGVEIAPLHAAGNRYWFSTPATANLGLRSNAGVLAYTMPGLTDRRVLGVALSEVRINGKTIALDDAAFADGFYPAERHNIHAWRWTNGEAVLARAVDGPAMVEVAVHMVAPSWKRRAAVLQLVANG